MFLLGVIKLCVALYEFIESRVEWKVLWLLNLGVQDESSYRLASLGSWLNGASVKLKFFEIELIEPKLFNEPSLS